MLYPVNLLFLIGFIFLCQSICSFCAIWFLASWNDMEVFFDQVVGQMSFFLYKAKTMKRKLSDVRQKSEGIGKFGINSLVIVAFLSDASQASLINKIQHASGWDDLPLII